MLLGRKRRQRYATPDDFLYAILDCEFFLFEGDFFEVLLM